MKAVGGCVCIWSRSDLVLLQNGWEVLPVKSAFLTSSVVRADVFLCDPLRSLQSVQGTEQVEQGDEPATGHLLDFSLSVSLGHVTVKRGRFLDRLVRK